MQDRGSIKIIHIKESIAIQFKGNIVCVCDTCSMTFKREANLRNHKRNVHEIVVDFKGQKGNNKSKPKSKKAVISNEVSSEVEEMNATENIYVERSVPVKEKNKI